MSGGGSMREKRGHLAVVTELVLLMVLCIRLAIGWQGSNKGIAETKRSGKNMPVFLADAKETERVDAKEKMPVLERPKVALTFDDGPSSKYTPQLLAGLKERNVQATFFLMGKNIEGKEELVRQMQEEGHLIGNHTYDHVELDKISREAAKEEITDTNKAICAITGNCPSFLRPPYGSWPKNLDLYVTMFPVLWDIDTLDWKSKNVESILQIVLSQVEDGSVILMHDAYQSSVDAALKIVDFLTDMGYEFVTVDKLILV